MKETMREMLPLLPNSITKSFTTTKPIKEAPINQRWR